MNPALSRRFAWAWRSKVISSLSWDEQEELRVEIEGAESLSDLSPRARRLLAAAESEVGTRPS